MRAYGVTESSLVVHQKVCLILHKYFLHNIDIDSDSDKSGEELYTVYGRIETRGFFI